MDRIDICVEASPMTFREMQANEKNESSAEIRKRVIKAWEIQKKRFQHSNCHFNSAMQHREVNRYCRLTPRDQEFLSSVSESMKLSARGCHKILKTARTIADLDRSPLISRPHLAEAVSYRRLEEKYWGKGV